MVVISDSRTWTAANGPMRCTIWYLPLWKTIVRLPQSRRPGVWNVSSLGIPPCQILLKAMYDVAFSLSCQGRYRTCIFCCPSLRSSVLFSVRESRSEGQNRKVCEEGCLREGLRCRSRRRTIAAFPVSFPLRVVF